MSRDPLLDVLERLVTNQLPATLPTNVAFIVGSNPSKGARSPRLWNAVFGDLAIDGEMLPLDVSSDQIDQLAKVLEQDQRVIGVAIAAPYKREFAKLLAGQLSQAAKKAGSINLLSRRTDGSFIGNNTDGLAAIESLLEIEPNLAESNVLVLGCGGTGRAVIASLLEVVGSRRMTVVYRNPQHQEWLNGVGVSSSPVSSAPSVLRDKTTVINCTSVGWGSQIDQSPLTIDELGSLPRTSLVFDVVYQPDPSKLLIDARSLGLRTLSGSRMNLLQAVLAFRLSLPDAKRELVMEAMQNAAM
jgi:shikimate dehydrogenase